MSVVSRLTTKYVSRCRRIDRGSQIFVFYSAIVAGTSLKGKVVLTVQRKIDPANLCLRLLGKENTIISRATKST